jgi:hypothetical protein
MMTQPFQNENQFLMRAICHSMTITNSHNDQEIPESALSDYAVAANRFADLGLGGGPGREGYGVRELEIMISAIRMVRGSG